MPDRYAYVDLHTPDQTGPEIHQCSIDMPAGRVRIRTLSPKPAWSAHRQKGVMTSFLIWRSKPSGGKADETQFIIREDPDACRHYPGAITLTDTIDLLGLLMQWDCRLLEPPSAAFSQAWKRQAITIQHIDPEHDRLAHTDLKAHG